MFAYRRVNAPSSLWFVIRNLPFLRMARTLIKLPCGVIHTPEFADHIQRVHHESSADHPYQVLAFDYVRCASGPQQGSEWCQLAWVPEQSAPADHRHRIGEVDLFIQRQSIRGLRGRCLHAEGGQIVVLS